MRRFLIGLLVLCAALTAPVGADAGSRLPPGFHFPRLNLPHVYPTRPHFGDPGYRGRPRSRDNDYERVTSFVSEIAVGGDGALTVHETIRVASLGHRLRHGIFRDLPAYGWSPNGDRARMRVEVLSVKRDGHDEPYDIEMQSHGRRIRIGDGDVDVPSGPHAYEITYRTNRQAGMFANFDEVYWNVTGTGWNFDIEQTVVTIALPIAGHVIGTTAYTGEYGSREEHAVAEHPDDRTVVVRTTRTLRDGQGLTVAVEFAKGAVAAPEGMDRVTEFLHDNQDTSVVLIGMIALAAYFTIAWMMVGRDPDAGPVAPLYEVPHNISPAGARYIMRMGFDAKAFAATLVSLAVKRVLSVRDEPHLLQHIFTLVRTGTKRRSDLTRGEGTVAAALFAYGHEIELTRHNQPRIAIAIAGLKHALHEEFDAIYFVNNRAWFMGGIAIVVISALAAAYFSDMPSDLFVIFQLTTYFGIGAAQFGRRAAGHWSAVYARHGSRVLETVRALLWTLGTLPWVAGLTYFMFSVSDALSPYTIAALFGEGFIACVFYDLLKAPTAAGAKLRNELKGFRMFLQMTEQEQLEVKQPVNVTPETFEKYLPYAIALDCENAWGRRFESEIVLASTAAMSQRSYGFAYSPAWYSSSGFARTSTLATFAFGLGDGLDSAMSHITVHSMRGGFDAEGMVANGDA